MFLKTMVCIFCLRIGGRVCARAHSCNYSHIRLCLEKRKGKEGHSKSRTKNNDKAHYPCNKRNTQTHTKYTMIANQFFVHIPFNRGKFSGKLSVCMHVPTGKFGQSLILLGGICIIIGVLCKCIWFFHSPTLSPIRI